MYIPYTKILSLAWEHLLLPYHHSVIPIRHSSHGLALLNPYFIISQLGRAHAEPADGIPFSDWIPSQTDYCYLEKEVDGRCWYLPVLIRL